LFQSIVLGEFNFAEVGFSHIIQHPKSVISPALSEVEGTGGTALLAVPERRNLSSPSDFRLNL
jgi:hypothetical protein